MRSGCHGQVWLAEGETKTAMQLAVERTVWSENPIRDISWCCQPLNGVHLRFGPCSLVTKTVAHTKQQVQDHSMWSPQSFLLRFCIVATNKKQNSHLDRSCLGLWSWRAVITS